MADKDSGGEAEDYELLVNGVSKGKFTAGQAYDNATMAWANTQGKATVVVNQVTPGQAPIEILKWKR